jgi:G3E family GTPase
MGMGLTKVRAHGSLLTRMLSMSGGFAENDGGGGDSGGGSGAAAATPTAMPITVMSGFLGAGKTSFLQNAVKNAEGLRYGLVVNDMAAVNVDSKLIKRQTSGAPGGPFDGIDTMELQNGCVCCTLAEDMMASVSQLVQLADTKGMPYDHIIVECSGIAEPRNIRDLFQEAEDYNMPLLRKIRLDTLVTVVDATVFMQYFGSNSEISSNPALAFRDTDEMVDREVVEARKVTELLLEQVECADVVLINKVDLLKDRKTQLPLLEKVVRSMNPTAEVRTCERGGVRPQEVLGTAKAEGAADWGILDEHRMLVTAVKASSCTEPNCTDLTHNHDHSRDYEAKDACSEPGCTEPTHDHDHDHDHSDASCSVTTCTDPTHDHAHDHSHSHDSEEMTTARERFGITSFVYSRRRPFHPERYSAFLQGMGKLSVDGMDDVLGTRDMAEAAPGVMSAAKSLMRSKGFVWIATSRTAAYFMSHAGQFLEMVVLGRWWADIPRAEWPVDAEKEIMVDYDPAMPAHGDRRQELVFIGQFANDAERKALEEVLDACLLTDDEFALYEQTAPHGDDALRTLFFGNK